MDKECKIYCAICVRKRKANFISFGVRLPQQICGLFVFFLNVWLNNPKLQRVVSNILVINYIPGNISDQTDYNKCVI